METALTIVKQALSANRKNDPRSLIELALMAAQEHMGGRPDHFDSLADEQAFNANSHHSASIALARLAGRSDEAFRIETWDMISTGRWADIRIPVSNPDGTALLDEYGFPEVVAFENEDEWFDTIAEHSSLDDAIIKATRLCNKRLLPFITEGNVPLGTVRAAPDGKGGRELQFTPAGRQATADDVFAIRRANLEVIMSSVGKILDTEEDLDRASQLIGGIVGYARTATKPDLKKTLSGGGLRGDRLTTAECYTALLPDGNTAYTIVANEAFSHFLEGILKDRVNQHPVEALAALIDIIGKGDETDDTLFSEHQLNGA